MAPKAPNPAGSAKTSKKRKEPPDKSTKGSNETRVDGDSAKPDRAEDWDHTSSVASHLHLIHETQKAMAQSKAFPSRQAFQKLPRDQRRRTMGHDDSHRTKESREKTRAKNWFRQRSALLQKTKASKSQ